MLTASLWRFILARKKRSGRDRAPQGWLPARNVERDSSFGELIAVEAVQSCEHGLEAEAGAHALPGRARQPATQVSIREDLLHGGSHCDGIAGRNDCNIPILEGVHNVKILYNMVAEKGRQHVEVSLLGSPEGIKAARAELEQVCIHT